MMTSLPGRFYIATGTSRYPDGYPPLPVESDLSLISSVFEKLGYKNALPELSLNPSRDGIINAIQNWLQREEQKDEVIFYYSGHGETQDRHYLALSEGECATEDIFRVFARYPVPRSLLILDTCYSGQATIDIGRILAPHEDNLERKRCYITVVTSARTIQRADANAFTPALARALENADGQWGGRNQAVVPIQEVMRAVLDQLPEWQQSKVDSFPATRTGIPEFHFPNTRYVPWLPGDLDLESQRKAIERQTHWDPRVQYFTGRREVLRRIDEWLSADSSGGRPVVVTGSPGTGKSALLARLVTQEKADISLHARGKTLSQATELLARASGVSLPGEELADEKARAELLVVRIREQQQRRVIAVDALDEAKQPYDIASSLLAPLGRISHVWLILGTRPNTTAQKPSHRYRALGAETIEIDLDEASNIGRHDLADYIDLRLRAPGESPLQTRYREEKTLRDHAVKAIAKRAGVNFLIAKLTCDRLLRDNRDPAAAQPWNDVRDADVGAEFDEYLRRFDTLHGWTKKKAVDLLEPLAHAQGQGFPWEGLWAPAAKALSLEPYTDSDIRELLQEAAPYIIESVEDGHSVYRLFHESLAEHLRSTGQSGDKHTRITRVLAESAPRLPDGRVDWFRAHPYSRRYLALHAAEAGLLDDFVVDPGFIVAADPAGLKIVLARCKSTEARTWAAVYSLAAHDLGRDIGERISYLELAALKLRESLVASRLKTLSLPRSWCVTNAHHPRTTPHWTLEGHQGWVRSVAVGERQGRAVIVSGSWDNTVRVWDLETLEPLGAPLQGHLGSVNSVAVGERQGRAVIVSGSADYTVRVWDLETLEPVGAPLEGHQMEVRSVAVGERQGRAVIVSGSADNTVRVWDPETLEPVGAPLEGHQSWVRSVAVGERQGRAVIVSGSADNTVRVWDLETLEPVGAPLEGHQNSVTSVAVGERQGRTVIVSGSWDKTVRVWDLETLEPVGAPLEGHQSWVRSVAVGERQGRAVIVSGSADNTVRVWDPETLEPVGAPLEGHQMEVTSVAVGERQGRAVIVSGSVDNTVRVWDPETLEPVGAPLEGHQMEVTSVAVGERQGRAVIVSGGNDNTVRVWDLERLEPVLKIRVGVRSESTLIIGEVMIVAAGQSLIRIHLS